MEKKHKKGRRQNILRNVNVRPGPERESNDQLLRHYMRGVALNKELRNWRTPVKTIIEGKKIGDAYGST